MAAQRRHVRGKNTCEAMPPKLWIGNEMFEAIPEARVGRELPMELCAKIEAHRQARGARFGKRRSDRIVRAGAVIRASMLVVEDRGRERAVLGDQRT